MSGDLNDFSLGIQLKEFSVFNCNSDFERLDPNQKERKDLDGKESFYKDLSFKKV